MSERIKDLYKLTWSDWGTPDDPFFFVYVTYWSCHCFNVSFKGIIWMRTALFWVITQRVPARNNSAERSSQLFRGISLKSRIGQFEYCADWGPHDTDCGQQCSPKCSTVQFKGCKNENIDTCGRRCAKFRKVRLNSVCVLDSFLFVILRIEVCHECCLLFCVTCFIVLYCTALHCIVLPCFVAHCYRA